MTQVNTDTEAFVSFLAGAENIRKQYSERMGFDFEPLQSTQGRVYIKIIEPRGGVWAFIDRLNGDVLKPASWKAPAKHARGNIFDAANGLKSIGPYGPAYLK